MLLLDGQTRLAESDDIYTQSLMSDVDYTGADILILGGGDGALLAQLLTKTPDMVTMVELDGAVMRVVRDFMPSVTGGVLDNHEGDHYKIITGELYSDILSFTEMLFCRGCNQIFRGLCC